MASSFPFRIVENVEATTSFLHQKKMRHISARASEFSRKISLSNILTRSTALSSKQSWWREWGWTLSILCSPLIRDADDTSLKCWVKRKTQTAKVQWSATVVKICCRSSWNSKERILYTPSHRIASRAHRITGWKSHDSPTSNTLNIVYKIS